MSSPAPFRRSVRDARERLVETVAEVQTGSTTGAKLDAHVRNWMVEVLVVLLTARHTDSVAGDCVDLESLARFADDPDGRAGELDEVARSLRRATGIRPAGVGGDEIARPPPDALNAAAASLADAVRLRPRLDHLGELHQEFHRRSVEIDGGTPTLRRRDSRRHSGIYYTPRSVVSEIVEGATAALLDETDRHIHSIRILDPAVGSGTFLCETLRELVERHRRAGTFGREVEMLRHLLRHSLFGVDLDDRALELARWNLRLAALDVADGRIPLAALAVTDSLAAGNSLVFATRQEARTREAPPPSFDDVLRAEHDLESTEHNPLHWERHFDEILSASSDDPAGFDAALGNPPWVSFGLRDAGALPPELDAYLRERFSSSAEYKLPTYPLFVELGLRMLRPGGVLSYLLPDSFLTGSRFSKLREILLDHTELDELTLLSDDPWSGSTSGACVVVRAAVPEDPPDDAASNVRVRQVQSAAELRDGGRDRRRPAEEIARGPDRRLELLVDETSRDLVRQMRAGSVPLGDSLDFYSGCIARYGQASVRAPRPRDRWTIRDGDDDPVLEDREARPRWRPLVETGRHVRPFEIYRSGVVLYVHPDRAVRRVYAKSGFDVERYERPKLFLRQTGHELVAARDDRGAFCFNNLHVANARNPGVDLDVLAAILNSAALQAFYRAVSMEDGRSLAQTALERLRMLPVPPAHQGEGERLSRTARERHEIGALLADADRRFARRIANDGTSEWDEVALGPLVERHADLTLERRVPRDVEGRATAPRLCPRDDAIVIRAEIDGTPREIVRLEAAVEPVGSTAFLALRESLRRQWRRRVWGRGDPVDALTQSIELRWPVDLEARSRQPLIPAAARGARLDEALEREICRLYDISPELVSRAAS